MALFSIVVLPAKKLVNGRHRVRIAVAHRSQTRYIATSFILDSLSQFRDGRVVRHAIAEQINACLRKTIDEYALIASSLSYAQELSCTELIRYIREEKRKKCMKLDTVMYEYLNLIKEGKREKSYLLYKTAFVRFYQFIGHSIVLGRLNPTDIRRYMEYLEQSHLSNTTIRIYLTLIKVLINYAIKMNYVSYDVHPFAMCRMPASHIRKLDLTVEELKRLRDTRLQKKNHLLARDIFILTYYLGGMNLRDLLAYRFDKQTNILHYVRHKTSRSKMGENETVFTIQPEAWKLIEKYLSPSGQLHFGSCTTYEQVYSLVFRNLPKVGQMAGVASPLSYYSARKSFAQHGYDIGVQMETIEYCIGHSMKKNRPICNYIRIMQTHADAAMRKIFDQLLR